MIRRSAQALLALATLALAACNPGRQATQPPARYQGDAVAVVRFTSDPVDACKGAVVEAGHGPAEACEANGVIVVSNPCTWPGSDPYAELLCHEKGHASGWPASHPPN